MKLSKYIHCISELDLQAVSLILCTEAPFYYGQVLKGISQSSAIAYAKKQSITAGGSIFGYDIHIVLLGALHETLIIGDNSQLAKDLAKVAREMADFYYTSKIESNQKRYVRYKSNQ